MIAPVPGRLANIVSIRRLEQLLGRSRADLYRLADDVDAFYRPFDIRRPGTDKWRHIDNPVGELKRVQAKIQKQLLAHVELPPAMFGAVTGRSIRDNAEHHLRQPLLVTLDLRDCFLRTHDLAVFEVFRHKIGCSPEIAALLTRLTTCRHRLPQGAPTSPSLANLTLMGLYEEMLGLASSLEIACTFYLDDIALSGDRACDAIGPAIDIIHRHGHSVRRNKIRRMPRETKQLVTGVVVNRKPSVDRQRRDKIRARLFKLATERVVAEHELRSIEGEINFIRFIAESQGESLRALAARLLPAAGVPLEKERRSQTERCTLSRSRRCKGSRSRSSRKGVPNRDRSPG